MNIGDQSVFDTDQFVFQVERWTRDGSKIEETLCLASHLVVAKGAYEAACQMDHRGRITLRSGIRVIRERPFVEESAPTDRA